MSTKPAIIEAGVSTMLQCITNAAFPTATIMWILDNTTITQGVTSTTERVPGSGFITTSSLTKTYASKDDGKMLVCSATNGEYTVTSPALQLSITGALTRVSMSTKPAMIEAGDVTVLQCVTNPAFPIATIMWILDNTNITQGVTSSTERVPGSGFITTSYLIKTYASKDDRKMLVCSATNGEYTVTSPALQLSITGALTGVSMSTKPAMIEAGVSTVLQCVTNPAFPTATIMWILDNTHITQGVTSTTERVPGSGFITTSNLIKTYASEDDGKMLVCSAINGEYTVSSPAWQLSITDDPERMSALSTGAITGIVIAVVLALAIPTVWILYKRIKRQPDAVEENTHNRTEKSEVERSQIVNPAFTQPD
ncbi:nephrin-like [Gigantopelta aegis]|uniref:nephrin-like n=1 Tax=Gigantopelta aegis TaxID=1735272 RepID=UPI001B88B965|nr:nephrin-like [Gigantopelta aegis]